MDYSERYIIKVKRRAIDGGTYPGELGPFESQAGAQEVMQKIIKGHSHLSDVYWAHMYRISEVMLAGFVTSER